MIRVESIGKAFDDPAAPALRQVSFSVPRGSIYTLLGPSGCGKTTSLRCVAGLEAADTGRISLGGRTVFSAEQRINLSPDRRKIGMVFQSYAIWPHMTVRGNVSYPLSGRGLSKAERQSRVERALDLVGLGALGDRAAPQLSGGQQQRVALARAIVSEPEILLLDEPLSNLDAKLRDQMRHELATLQKQLDITMLYVTHDQEEAIALSHRIALLRNGVIVEEGEPVTMYRQPRHPFTAAFLGNANFLKCELSGTARDGERVEVSTSFGRFAATARLGEDDESRLFFRPNTAQVVAPTTTPPVGCGAGRVVEAVFLGEGIDVVVSSGVDTIRLRLHRSDIPTVGSDITFRLIDDECTVFLPALAGSRE